MATNRYTPIEMDPIDFSIMCKPYNAQYRNIFGYVPCSWDYKCNQDEYFRALLLAIETRQDISTFVKKVCQYSDPNVRH